MFKFAPEGYPFIAVFAIITIIVFIIGNVWIALPPFILTIFMLYFFRDPERKIPEGEGLFVSPADGKVILIKEIKKNVIPPHPPLEKEVRGDLKNEHGGFIEISIFMSPLNVHVNRAPCEGKVKEAKHNKGRFLAAYKDDASIKNENIEMVLETKHGKVLVRQVAGFIARRAVCRVKVGDKLKRGERYGIIKFSSRLDIYLPKETEIKVKLADKVKAGETIIGKI